MDIQDTYFKRIVYKKNAYEDMKSFLKFYHTGKNMLILYDNESESYDNFLISIAESQNAFSCHRITSFGKKEISSIKKKAEDFSLIIGFGNAEICNLAKAVANAKQCEYILCPTTYSLENLSCYFYEPLVQNVYKKGNYPTKIYIDEKVIKSLDLIVVGNALKTLVSFYEILFSFYLEKEITIFNFNKQSFQKCLNRFDEIFIQISQNNDDAKLVLMDNFIELGFMLKNFSFNQFSCYNLAHMLQKLNLVEGYGIEDYLLISSDILLSLYEKTFEQKNIKQYYQSDFYEIASIIEKYNFNIELYKKFEFYNTIVKNKELFMKLNSVKVKIYLELENIIREFKEKLKQVNMFLPVNNAVINLEKVYHSVNVLPFIYQNNLLIDVIASVGILSF